MRLSKPLLSIVFVVTMLTAFSGCQESPESNADSQASLLTQNPVMQAEIGAKEAHQQLTNENVILIDVRTPEEYEEYHLENSILMPVQTLESNLAANNEITKDNQIIVYCRSGNRSMTAYNIMKELGYENVQSMAGGIKQWHSLEYKTCSGDLNTC